MYVCSEYQYKLLEEGEKSISVIGFPKYDVFKFYDCIKDPINLNTFNWGRLKLLDEEI